MTAAALIADLSRAGVRLERRGDRLHVEAPKGMVTPELRQTLTQNKADLLAALSDPLRAHLLQLAAEEGIDAERIRTLHDDDQAGCEGLSDGVLRAYVRGLRDSDLREHGRVPADETAEAMCRHCGPVYVAPEVAQVAPIVDGWPTLIGCPWCHTRSRDAIPRPRMSLQRAGDGK